MILDSEEQRQILLNLVGASVVPFAQIPKVVALAESLRDARVDGPKTDSHQINKPKK